MYVECFVVRENSLIRTKKFSDKDNYVELSWNSKLKNMYLMESLTIFMTLFGNKLFKYSI